jgi:hypothetical protein
MTTKTCGLCDNDAELMQITEKWLIGEIAREHPDWVADDGACAPCIAYYRQLGDAVKVIDVDDD